MRAGLSSAIRNADHLLYTLETKAIALASKGVFLANTGNTVGELMGLGEIKAAAVHTTHYNLLLYDSKQHYLSIAVKPDCNLDSVEAEIKSAFVPAK